MKRIFSETGYAIWDQLHQHIEEMRSVHTILTCIVLDLQYVIASLLSIPVPGFHPIPKLKRRPLLRPKSVQG